jgi:ABC-2 type transport system permease protein
VIFTEELRVHLRSRWYIVFTALVVFLLLLAMLLVPALTGDEEGSGAGPVPGQDLRKIGFLDESGLFGDLEGANGPEAFTSFAAGLEAVAAGKIDFFYVVPADYLQSGEVEQYGEFPGRFPTNPGGEATLRAVLVHGLVAGRVDSAVAARVLAPAAFQNFRVQEGGTAAKLTPIAVEIGGLLVPMLFAILLGVGLAVGFGYMMQSVAEEKESRLVEVVVTSASPFSIMGGKLLALVVAGLVQAAVWVVTAACFITGYLLTTTLAIFVGAVAPSIREAGRMGGWVPVLNFAPFWVSGLLMFNPDGLAGELVSYVPLVAPTGVLLRVGTGGVMAAWQIAAALAGVVVLSLLVLWMSARMFRAAILMRGQNFTGHNLWRALRDAD